MTDGSNKQISFSWRVSGCQSLIQRNSKLGKNVGIAFQNNHEL